MGLKLIRRMPSLEPVLYLTFDDGPDPAGTPAVLELLKKYRAHASFFLIGIYAQTHPSLVKQIVAEGHAVGNHSPDHRYRNYFHSSARLMNWIEDGEKILRDVTGAPTIGFRPPAGVRTPPLNAAVRRLQIPLILWNTRFYDSVWSWRETRALKSLESARGGDVILLHDRQRPENRESFLCTLDIYLDRAVQKGFRFERLAITPTPAKDPQKFADHSH